MRITTTAVGGGLAAIVMNWSVLATNPYYLSLFILPFDFVVGLGMFTQASRLLNRTVGALPVLCYVCFTANEVAPDVKLA